MPEEDALEQQEPVPETTAAAPSKKPMIIGIACIVLGAIAGATLLPAIVSAMGHPEEQTQDQPTQAQQTRPRGVLIENPITVMVNLADENARRVLKADIVIEGKDRATTAKITQRQVEIKNSLIALLSEKRLADIEGAEAKEALRREIKLFLNERLQIPDAVLDIYFDQFIVQ